ncbi:hypothetical protein TNCV_696311 [Trichonephila clavipes]|nr:hypothetical protein TNCV_696311 [Trichonephila clavipes]
MRRYAGKRNGECLSSIKHFVGTTSGCFYPKSNHWEVGGRPQCDKCGCKSSNCTQHRFTTLETISNYRNSYRGSVVVVHEEPYPQKTGHVVLQARRKQAADSGEIARNTTQVTGRHISRFLPWPEDCTVVSVCTAAPVRCFP